MLSYSACGGRKGLRQGSRPRKSCLCTTGRGSIQKSVFLVRPKLGSASGRKRLGEGYEFGAWEKYQEGLIHLRDLAVWGIIFLSQKTCSPDPNRPLACGEKASAAPGGAWGEGCSVTTGGQICLKAETSPHIFSANVP